MARYWEDHNVGERFKTPGRTVTEAMINITAGIAGYAFSVFWDDEQAKNTALGSRIGPGPLTLFIMYGLEEQSGAWDEEAGVALVGIDKVRFRVPLRAGDTIRGEIEVIAKKETKRSDRGLIVYRMVCKNQRGEEIAEWEGTHLLKRRP